MSTRNGNSRNDKTNNEFNFCDESIDDASSVYMEERYTEVVTRKFRGGKSWMVGCETFYTTKRTKNPHEEEKKGHHHVSKWRDVSTKQEVEPLSKQEKPNMRSQDGVTEDFVSKKVNALSRPEVYGGGRPDVLVMKWHELPVMVEAKNSGEEKSEKLLVKENISTQGQLNSCSVAEYASRDVKTKDGILCHPEKIYFDNIQIRAFQEKHPNDHSKHRRRGTVVEKIIKPQENVTRSEDMRRGVRFSDDRLSETGLDVVSVDDVLEFESRRKTVTDRKPRHAGYSEDNKPYFNHEDGDEKFNISKKLSVENWLKHSMRYKTHERFKFDIEGIDFIEVNRLTCTDLGSGAISKRNIGVHGGHSKFTGGSPNLYSSMYSSRGSAFREGPSGRGHFARVFSDDNNEDFFLCASVFLFGHANLNSELRQVIELFSHQLHIRYPRDSVGPVTAEERQILSFAALFMTKVEALVRMSTDEYYWKAFDPPGITRPSRTLHLYYYASNYCDLIVKRELSDDFSWECN